MTKMSYEQNLMCRCSCTNCDHHHAKRGRVALQEGGWACHKELVLLLGKRWERRWKVGKTFGPCLHQRLHDANHARLVHVPWGNRLHLTLRSKLSWNPPRTEFHTSAGLRKRKSKGSLWKSLKVSRSLSGHLPLSLWFRSCSREAMLLHFNGKLKPWRSRRWVGHSDICSSLAQIFVREDLATIFITFQLEL